MRTGDATFESQTLGLGGEGFDMPRLPLVAFVAMHIDAERPLGSNPAESH